MGFFDDFFDSVKKLNDKFAADVSVKCSSCGATITGKETQKTLKCEFCGNCEANPHYAQRQQSNANNMGATASSIFSEDGVNEMKNDLNTIGNKIGGMFDRQSFKANDLPVYAIIKKCGLFYEGEIPGMSLSRVSMCHTYDECKDKLKSKFYKEKTRAFYKPPVQNIENIRKSNPDARIITFN